MFNGAVFPVHVAHQELRCGNPEVFERRSAHWFDSDACLQKKSFRFQDEGS